MGHADLSTVLLRDGKDLIAFLGIDSHRLFDKRVRACFQRTNGKLRMGARRRADIDHIELFGFQHLPVILVNPSYPIRSSEFLSLRDVGIAQCHHLGFPPDLFPSRQVLLFCDESRTDDADCHALQAFYPRLKTIL